MKSIATEMTIAMTKQNRWCSLLDQIEKSAMKIQNKVQFH